MNYLLDPSFKAPLIASILMCFAAGLLGVVSFVQRRSLVSEAISHATYPGLMFGGFISVFFNTDNVVVFMVSSLVSAFLGLFTIDLLSKKKKISQDASLCFVLSVFFGVGLLLASRLQFVKASVYQKLQVYLFGQMATMMDFHIYVYTSLSGLISIFFLLFYPRIQLLLFEKNSPFLRRVLWNTLLSLFFLLSIVVGIRSVGIVLMSGMLIAPAVFARTLTHRLSSMFWIAAIFGGVCAFLGNVFSTELSKALSLSFPTGPMIVLISSFLAFSALIFSPKRGAFFRFFRMMQFRLSCIEENVIKSLYKSSSLKFSYLRSFHPIFPFFLRLGLFRLQRQGFVNKKAQNYFLTEDGKKKALYIIRLHRLWEVYLTQYMGLEAEKVHTNAEEIEHIITPAIEETLTRILSNPKTDPHEQPIPGRKL